MNLVGAWDLTDVAGKRFWTGCSQVSKCFPQLSCSRWLRLEPLERFPSDLGLQVPLNPNPSQTPSIVVTLVLPRPISPFIQRPRVRLMANKLLHPQCNLAATFRPRVPAAMVRSLSLQQHPLKTLLPSSNKRNGSPLCTISTPVLR